MRILLIMSAALVLSACVPAEVFVMKNPKTGELIQCRSENHGSAAFPIIQGLQDNGGAENCAKGYEAAGWQRMN